MDLIRTKRAHWQETKWSLQEQSGYTKEEALIEAKRCLNCKHRPCEKGCVAHLPVPDFIQALKNNDLEEAQRLIYTKSKLSRICSRVCFQEKQCEGACTLGIKGESIAIGLLERYIGDNTPLPFKKAAFITDSSVGIIGSGPAALSCALSLLASGIQVELYEKQPLSGGVLRYGIPKYRLDNKYVNEIIEAINEMGGIFHNEMEVGKHISIEHLLTMHSYLFIGSGAGKAMQLGAINEKSEGVFSAFEVLGAINEETHPKHAYFKRIFQNKIVKVIGGGNVAMDCARSIARLMPTRVSILYRRSENELPARMEEVLEARLDGVKFELLLNPFEFVSDGEKLSMVKCRRMLLGDIDESGRCSVSEDVESCVSLEADYVVIAIGGIGEEYLKVSDIQINRKNLIEEVNATHQSTIERIYAGGDVLSGPLTVVSAMAQGVEVAKAIEAKLKAVI